METIKFSDIVKFSDKQQQAHEAVKDFKYILYGGAVGGGKSYWLRWELVYQLLRFAKDGKKNGVIVGLFCEDYPALKDRHLSKIGTEFPDWLGEMHQDHKNYGRSYILKKEYGAGVIAFRNLDDPSKYQSAEFAVIAIDELTKNEKSTFDDLNTRLRWPGVPDTKFIAGTNPGSKGHAWVKKWWLDRDFDDNEQSLKDEMVYVKAVASDNPHISGEYLKTLESLPEDKRKAFVEGNWDIFKGQYFSEFRREIHVIKPFEIPVWWKRYIWFDYGYNAQSAVYWVAIDEDGKVYIYRELYESGLTGSALAEKIVQLTPEQEWGAVRNWVGCHYIFAKKGESDITIAETIQKKYYDLTKRTLIILKGEQSPGARIVGWNTMREFLKSYPGQDGMPTAKLQIFEVCYNLIRTLPALIYSETRVEDVDDNCEDHAPEAIRIGLMSRPAKTPNTNPLANILNRSRTENKISPVINLE